MCFSIALQHESNVKIYSETTETKILLFCIFLILKQIISMTIWIKNVNTWKINLNV